MAQPQDAQLNAGLASTQDAPEPTRAIYRWAIGFGVVAVMVAVCLAVWGSGMGFPTTVSQETSSDGSRQPGPGPSGT